jgi:membrane-associated phospholipid phosphatase
VTGGDYAADVVMTVFMIFGVYQFYFWCQRNALTGPRELSSFLDDQIPFRPGWVWVYSGLYYPLIVFANFCIDSPREFGRVALSYIGLLFAQMFLFTVFPVATPEHWRHYHPRRGLSERFLAFVHAYDGRSNCFPSMHTSVAMLTAMHMYGHIGSWAWIFPLLISASCLYTKQHYVADVPAGAALGWAAYRFYAFIR